MLSFETMYYDRHIVPELADTLKEGAALAWLVQHVHSAKGRSRHAHIQFRRAPGDRRWGSVQLYWGRTSPLELQWRRGAKLRCVAHATYRQASPELFQESFPLEALEEKEAALRHHLDKAALILEEPECRRQALLKGEATSHAGMMWRYGHAYKASDPMLALDAEARVGFESRTKQREADAELRQRLELYSGEALPKKLDTIALSSDGHILLIEVKDREGDIRRALTQVVAHVARFEALLAHQLREVLHRMRRQKVMAGLIPSDAPELLMEPSIRPWVAAPTSTPDWAEAWSEQTQDLREKWSSRLGGLRWVRLTERGDVLEVRQP